MKKYDGLVVKASGAWTILDKRNRQIREEGFDENHDDKWYGEELVQAAKCYIDKSYPFYDAPMWPYRWDKKWFKPKDDIHNLIVAGALIAAEIDRLLRMKK